MKKIKSWLLVKAAMIVALFGVATNVNAEDKFYIPDFSIEAGETKQLAIQFESDKVSATDPSQLEYVAFQFDIYLPEGLTIVQKKGKYNFTFNTDRYDDHTFAPALQADGAIRVAAASMTNAYFWETSGDFVYFSVTAAADFAGDHEITMKTINFSEINGNMTTLADVTTKVTGPAAGDQTVAVTGITLDKTTAEVTEGESVTLVATVAPDNATDKTVTWTSSDETFATVTDGVVTTLKAGEVTITAKAGEQTATCVVTIKEKVIAVTGITLDKTTAEVTEGESVTLVATVAPDNATDKTVTWTSSDETFATVTDGVVTTLKAGEVTITAKAGEQTATCVITINAKGPRFDLTAYNDTVAWANEQKATLNAADEAEAEVIVTIDDFIASAAAWLADVEADPEATQADVDFIAQDLKAQVTAAMNRVPLMKLWPEAEALRMEADSVYASYTNPTDEAGLVNALRSFPRSVMFVTSVEELQAAMDALQAAMEAFIAENTVVEGPVALAADMFKEWDKVEADAQVIGDAVSEMGIGKEIGAGAMVYGASTVDPLRYADLTAYDKMIIEGTPGMQLRVLMNRALGGEPGSFNGALTEVNPVIGEDGKVEVDLTAYEYVHLNAIKTGWGSPAGTITSITLETIEPVKIAYLNKKGDTNDAIYDALVAAGYAVDSLAYADVTLSDEIIESELVGYDVVVLGGSTGSGANLAKTANLLLGKVNVISTKSFWYKHYGTNGTNPGSATAPSLNMAKVGLYAEHPIYNGIEGKEFAVFIEHADERTSGRYLQGNGTFNNGVEQVTLGTTLGADCIGEAWVDGKGYIIIPVDGLQPTGYLTADGAALFANAVGYLVAGEQFEAPRFDLTAYNDTVAWANEVKATLNAEDETEADAIVAIDDFMVSAAEWLEDIMVDPEATQADVDFVAQDLKAQVTAVMSRLQIMKMWPEVDAARAQGDSIVMLYPEDLRTDEAGLIVALQSLPRVAMWVTSVEELQTSIKAVNDAIAPFQTENNSNVADSATVVVTDAQAVLAKYPNGTDEAGLAAAVATLNTLLENDTTSTTYPVAEVLAAIVAVKDAQPAFEAENATKIAYLNQKGDVNDAIYDALVAAGYAVDSLAYADSTLTAEMIEANLAGYDVVVLGGNTGSGTALAKTANLLVGKVNVLSTKAFWYKHYGTNGDNPGKADNPSLNMAKAAGYEEHPIYAGIEGNEFAVFNDMGKESGRYLQSNGSFSNGPEQAAIGTTNGANCIGEAWVDGFGYIIIPVDGIQPSGYLTADGAQLFVNAVEYLIAGEQFEYNLVEGVQVERAQWPADIYDLSGRMVKKAATSLEGVDKGLYIINGKKVLVK